MVELRNPFIFAPIKLGYSQGNGYVNDRHIAFYTARSPYLAALTIEPLYMDKGLREIPTQLGIDAEDKIEGLQKLVASIHRTGAKVIAHLNHPGRMTNPKIPGNYFVSSTDRACENGGAKPKRMDRVDMKQAIELFVAAAKRAEKANFDIIELQFGHGYLLAQFLSPLVNDRTDDYGGAFENRIKFPLEVLQAVRDAVDLPVIARISGDEMLPNGIELPEMARFSKILEKNGVEAIHVSAGSVCSTPPWFFQHMFVPKGKTWEMAKTIQENLDIPVIFVGRVNTIEDIENLKNKYGAGYVSIGRALIADPDFVGKYLGEVKGNIRPCLACSDGCLGGVKSGKGLQCIINPDITGEKKIEPAAEKKNYAVIGGGIAGMEAALVLRQRGHKVTIYEKNRLGGAFLLAALSPRKNTLMKAIDYFVKEMAEKEVEIIYREPKPDELDNYDGVWIATGAKPAIPPVEGLENFDWADILLPEKMPENEKIFVIGGGLIGLETAAALSENHNTVIVVDILPELGGNMLALEKAQLLKKLKNNPEVSLMPETKVTKIEGSKAYLQRGDEKITIDGIDRFVVVAGVKSFNPLEDTSIDVPLYIIGDARKTGKAEDAIKDAFELAIK